MPIYEYRCQECGRTLEVLVRSGKEPKYHSEGDEQAGDCQGELTKLISRAGVIFKGTGFHVNDYSGAGADAGSNGKTDTSSSKSDSSSSSSESGGSSSTSSDSSGAAASSSSSSSSGSSSAND